MRAFELCKDCAGCQAPCEEGAGYCAKRQAENDCELKKHLPELLGDKHMVAQACSQCAKIPYTSGWIQAEMDKRHFCPKQCKYFKSHHEKMAQCENNALFLICGGD